MGLALVSLENVRCIESAELELDPACSLIWGSNGSGKPSILEALHLLGRGRSFRTRNSERVIRRGADRLLVVGRLVEPETTLGIQVARGVATVARAGGHPVGALAELSTHFPVQVIDPSLHKLIEEGGAWRRRWMDWAVFHVEPGFLTAWTRYQRALRQRNAALRTLPAEASAWDSELARSGEVLDDARRRSIERLQPYWAEVTRTLVGREVSMTYSRGWATDRTLAEALAEARPKDQGRLTTQVGPHRADIQVRIDGVAARDAASRGQQKLIAAAMILAQIKLVRGVLITAPTLLLDDPAAELDRGRLGAFIDQVAELRCQLILTTIAPDPGLFGVPGRRFHVEQGRVRPV